MTRPEWRGARATLGSPVVHNLAARLLALAALTAASLLVARLAGPAGIGAWSLLRLLPWLTGLLLGCGLYGATPYFLSGPNRADPSYRSTFPAMALAAGVAGAAVWLALTPVLQRWLFPQTSTLVVGLAAVTVLTQLMETTSKACSQGSGDLPGSNRVIVLEELVFVPWFAALALAGVDPYLAIVLALIAGDVTTAGSAWVRLVRRGYLRGSRPSWGAARRIARFGIRAELGSIALLLNARTDFAIVAAILGPSALGSYAIATRYAELLRLPGLAMNYVLYPQLAAGGGADRLPRARRAVRRMGWVPAALAVPMAVAAPVLLPLVYGPAFHAAVWPAEILLVGLATTGVNGITSAYLMADARPGAVSVAMGAGLVLTVGLDLLLVPRYGVPGAAVASTVAYLATSAVLATHLVHQPRRRGAPRPVTADAAPVP